MIDNRRAEAAAVAELVHTPVLVSDADDDAEGVQSRDTLPEGARVTLRESRRGSAVVDRERSLGSAVVDRESRLGSAVVDRESRRGSAVVDPLRVVPPAAVVTSAAAAPPAEDEQPDLIGVMLAERYRVESLLALGSVCEVFRARHMYLDRAVALKALREPLPPGMEGERDRLLREARALARLKHPHVVRIYDYGVTSSGRPYLVTELLEGATLEQILGQRGTRLSLRRACRLGAQVARVMAELHALGLVLGGQAGGLKASNLLVEQEASSLERSGSLALPSEAGGVLTGAVTAPQERVRLVDLSGVQAAGPAGRRALGLPELVGAGGGIDASLRRRDERALGELLYRMLTGTPFGVARAAPAAEGEAEAEGLEVARQRLHEALHSPFSVAPGASAASSISASVQSVIPATPVTPLVDALEALLLRSLTATSSQSEAPGSSAVSARHLEQVLQQVAHLEVVASEAPVVP